MSRQIEINRDVAARVLAVVDKGLSYGLGESKLGHMCVEAAVCFALGLPHGDDPACVARSVRSLKISLNDREWSSKAARARGLRRLAIAQLGSAGVVDDREFAKRVAEIAIRKCVPAALRSAASIQKDPAHKSAMLETAIRCEKEGTREAAIEGKNAAYAADASYAANAAAYAANAAAYAANAAAFGAYAAYAAFAAFAAAAYAAAYAKKAARDKSLAEFAEDVVQILIVMKSPGCEWLDLTEAQAA